jgi:hypothetical protein
MHDDPIVKAIREAGAELARRADNDLHALCEHLRAAEKTHPERVADPRFLKKIAEAREDVAYGRFVKLEDLPE